MAFKGWEFGIMCHPSLYIYWGDLRIALLIHHLNEVAPQFFPTAFFSNW